jgi:spore coat polysaccharide biosynthesis predicted glycosyltransferase SpsG
VKKLNNFSKNKIIFRCDAANISDLGTGHVFRSINIANFLKKKFKLKKKQICFLIKFQNKFKVGHDLVKKNGYKIIKLDQKISDYSSKEIEVFNKYKSNLLIIDRLGKINPKFINKIKNNFKKKIILEDSSIYRKEFDLSLNPLIRNIKKVKNSKIGFEYMILRPNKPLKTKPSKKNHALLFFGGFDRKEYSIRVLQILNNLKFRLNIYVPKVYKRYLINSNTFHKLKFFDNKSYLNKLKISNVIICSGGLGLFDSILINKKIICLPQYEHQKNNAKELSKKKAIHYFAQINKNKILNTFIKIYDNQIYEKKIKSIHKKIIDLKKLNRNYDLIGKIYEQSISK